MVKEFDHIGVVVKDTKETAGLLSSLFGFWVTETQEFPEQGFKSTLVSKEKITIELIEPIGTQGIIQKFIEKSGYGLHHISLRVDDIEQEIDMLESMGVKVLNRKPAKITDTSEISFLHPSSTAGILIELMHRTSA
jgi:methylmalonyl-CoA/ethylmalonyl-CoA epimerase